MEATFFKKILCSTPKTILLILLASVTWTICLPYWLIVKVIRALVSLAYGENYCLASGWDSIFGYSNVDFTYFVQGYGVFEGNAPSLEHIQNNFQEMLDSDASLNKLRLVVRRKYGFDCWVKCKDFQVKNHIKELEVGDEGYTRENICQAMEELSDFAIGELEDSPQWAIWLVPTFRIAQEKNDGVHHFAIILRIHHIYGDAISMVLMANSKLGNDRFIFPIDPRQPLPSLGKWKTFVAYLDSIYRGPYQFFKFYVILPRFFDSPLLHVYKYSKRTWHVTAKNSIDLSALKALKNKSKTSVVAILLVAISSVFDKSKKLAGLTRQNKLGLGVTGTLAVLPYKVSFQNQFSLFNVRIPLLQKTDRKQSLVRAYKIYKYSLEQGMPIFVTWITKMWGDSPCCIKNLFNITTRTSPIVLSNIPGPLNLFMVGESRLVDVVGWVPFSHTNGKDQEYY